MSSPLSYQWEASLHLQQFYFHVTIITRMSLYSVLGLSPFASLLLLSNWGKGEINGPKCRQKRNKWLPEIISINHQLLNRCKLAKSQSKIPPKISKVTFALWKQCTEYPLGEIFYQILERMERERWQWILFCSFPELWLLFTWLIYHYLPLFFLFSIKCWQTQIYQ